MKLTKEQQKALYGLYVRKIDVKGHPFKAPPCQSYASFRRTVQHGFGDYVAVAWCGMYVGIEKDGYTHT